MRKNNSRIKNNTSLVLSVIGDLLRGNDIVFTDVGIWGYACYDCCMLSSPAFVCMHAEL